jgi:hypothetical protein
VRVWVCQWFRCITLSCYKAGLWLLPGNPNPCHRYLRNVRVTLITSVYIGVWDIHQRVEASLRDPTSQLGGELAWILNVLGYCDRVVDERIENHRRKQFTRRFFSHVSERGQHAYKCWYKDFSSSL